MHSNVKNRFKKSKLFKLKETFQFTIRCSSKTNNKSNLKIMYVDIFIWGYSGMNILYTRILF